MANDGRITPGRLPGLVKSLGKLLFTGGKTLQVNAAGTDFELVKGWELIEEVVLTSPVALWQSANYSAFNQIKIEGYHRGNGGSPYLDQRLGHTNGTIYMPSYVRGYQQNDESGSDTAAHFYGSAGPSPDWGGQHFSLHYHAFNDPVKRTVIDYRINCYDSGGVPKSARGTIIPAEGGVVNTHIRLFEASGNMEVAKFRVMGLR